MSTLDSPIQTQPQVSYRPVGLRFGLIASMVLIALGLIGQVAGLSDPANQSGPGGIAMNILTYGIMIAAIVMAVKQHRDSDLGGLISFKRAFGLGMFVILIIGAITMVWTFIYMSYINPDLVDQIMEVTQEKQQAQGLSDEQIEAAAGMMGMFMKPWAMALFAFAGTLLIGLIISLIVAAIMKKEAKTAAL
ncbi:MAG: DUF4199 domain-containing protein [Haliscomenobacter sp.]|nr:DUF4199 domain-containing protein [Haliscomenobacter sp.]MBK8656451.1 DUF4199 domain-containing protein [Haliscomenobacter sp.]MBP9076844.1 DUF4199 domain-containing protein [Haliscomenobacter sp.]MBP9873512.1 DUF4199 domain-containing protein [Haliscomenobacter sp.]